MFGFFLLKNRQLKIVKFKSILLPIQIKVQMTKVRKKVYNLYSFDILFVMISQILAKNLVAFMENRKKMQNPS